MRQKDLKYFGDIQSGRLNSDDSPFAITTNEWVNAENVRSGTTDKGATGVIESVGGNQEIPEPTNLQSVLIGDQRWTSRNLDVTKYRNGDDITQITDSATWDTYSYGAWCWYNNDPLTGIKLYNWWAVNDPRGLAPIGWRVPSDYDWQVLENYLVAPAGGKLKERGLGHWNAPNTGAINSSGFTAQGDGFRYAGFDGIKEATAFWSATSVDALNANIRYLLYNSEDIGVANSLKYSGYSVRLVTSNSQYITIGTIDDTENKRLIYFDYDTIRSHPAEINNIVMSVGVGGFDRFYTSDTRIFNIKIGSQFQLTSGIYAGTYTCLNIQQTSAGYYVLYVDHTFLVPDPDFLTDIVYSAPGEDKIVCLYTDTNTQYNVLLSSQVVGGLNFDKNSLIHSAHIANNVLSWTDGTNNEPRKINIESGISANYLSFPTQEHRYLFPLNFSEITLIKPPPIFTPIFTKVTDTTFLNNFIANESFEFAFQYQYYDNETSVISSYSRSTRLNNVDDTFNKVTVTMDYANRIPDTVKIVNLIVRNSDTNFSFIGRTWNKSYYDDENQINNHNGYLTPLTFNFYNDSTGLVNPEYDTLRPFDNVPIYSQTHEIAKQRYFLANNIDGYDTPLSTSMTLNIGSPLLRTGINSRDSQLFLIRHWGVKTFLGVPYDYYGYAGWYVNLPWADRPGFYLCLPTSSYEIYVTNANAGYRFPTPPTAPTTTPYDNINLLYQGQTITEVRMNNQVRLGIDYNNNGESGDLYPSIPVTGVTLNAYNAFPQLSIYKSGIAFYDYAMRKCGVVTKKECIVTTSEREFNYTVAEDSFSWTLDNTSALAEIPDWAYYYAPVLTKNLSKRFFIQAFTDVAKYFSKNLDGTYNYTSSAFVSGAIGIALPTASLNQAALGYIYTEGDTCILTKDIITISATAASVGDVINAPTAGLAIGQYVQIKSGTGQFELSTTIINIIDGASFQVSVAPAIALIAGDQVSVYQYYTLSVIGQDNGYILLKSKNIGDLASARFVYEIYTPYKTSEQEPYYEMGQIYGITNPTTSARQYPTLSGLFYSDSYILTRNWSGVTYLANTMSPNDLYYKNWFTDTGKVNIVTLLGQVDNNTEIVWSDTYVSGTQINGSSTFRLGSQSFVSDDCGSITKIQNTSKVQDQGTVMLALCTTETNSMYLGETQITDSTGGVKFFSSGTGVIGTINILKGNYGCIDPASVVQYRGNVYFFDASNGRWVQYSANGLDNIAAVKMSRFWKNWAYQYMNMTKAEIEAFGDRPYVFATVDPGHDELLITIPKLSDNPPKGYLPDYPEVIYPFDILDYQGKTVVYKLGTGAVVQPHWQGAYTFTTEYFCTIQNRLFSFKNGNAWEHNIDDQNIFYGVYSPSKIMFTSNILPQMPKVYDNFLSESNIVPNFVYFYNEFPYLQTSDLEDISFVQKEGIWYAQILRNKVVPTTSGDVYTGLLTAEVMRNTNMFVLAEYSPTTSPLQLRILELGMSISRGHIV